MKSLMLAALAAALATTTAASAQAPIWRDVDPENVLVVDTNKGRIIAELAPFAAPSHVERIKTLTRQGFYDGRSFFRVIDGFMNQTGDPQDNGKGGSTLPNLQPEFSFRRGPATPFTAVPSARSSGEGEGVIGVLPVVSQPDAQMAITADGKVSAQGLFCPGVLGMARANEPDSANSQFFFMRGETPALNGKYTVFGRVLIGLDVVRAIKTGEPVPEPQDRMLRVRLLADIPTGERPMVQVQSTTGPAFAAHLQAQRNAKGAAFTVCDLDIAANVK
jgi:peptidylprolyl isomerase